MLTAAKLKEVATPGTYHAGPNLYAQIKPNGARSWVCVYQLNGRRRQMGLGAMRYVGITEARDLAFEAAKLARKGVDPIELRRKERKASAILPDGPTFKECATDYIEAHKAGWRSAKTEYQWTASLETYAAPVIGSLPVASVTVEHVVDILRPIWTTKSVTAGRVQTRIEAVLRYATAKRLRKGDNPATWAALSHMFPSLSKVRKVAHHAAVPHASMPKLMAALSGENTSLARAIMLVALTATRSGEVRGARWGEIDFHDKVWTVPAERMKMQRPHRVPLSDAALAVLKLEKRGAPDDLVFAGAKAGQAPSDVGMLRAIRRLAGPDSSIHGLRSTFRDWCAERGVARDVAEASLAHAVGSKVEAAYLRSDLLDRRRVLMADWADHCMGAGK